MTKSDKMMYTGIFFFINAVFALSCSKCWKVSVIVISIGIFSNSIFYICCKINPDNIPNRIHPIEEINSRHRRISITLNNIPDFSNLYVNTILSPLHKKSFCCSICLDDSKKNIKTLLCGHEFHQSCIEEWFKVEQTCPLCRDDFINL
tara:strand:- start:706 stop:1149 length:444 start_codon:yes stop_codon:yes gene_type:complete